MRLQSTRAYGKKIEHLVATALPLPDPTKFAVITRGRTGSNLLLSLLHSHPRVRQCGEIIGEYALQQPDLKKEILDLGPVLHVSLCFKRTGFESAVGIKVLYYQVENSYGQIWGLDGLPDVMDFLKSQQDIRIIHLKRRNRLKTLTSIHVAALTNNYREVKNQSERVDNIKISLTIDECQQEFRNIGQWEKLYDDAFQDHKILETYYENLVAERQAECDRILDFLSVRRRILTTPMKKQLKSPLSEVIDNYDMLKIHFDKTEWARFFEE